MKNVAAVIAVNTMAPAFVAPGHTSALGVAPVGVRVRTRLLGTTQGIHPRT